MTRLQNKVAIVTGASKGIGAAIAVRLAADGASVVVNYASSREGADRVVSEINGNGGKAIAIQADVSRQADIDRLFAETKRAFGRLDVLVNNAGVFDFIPLDRVTEEHFHRHFNLNVLGLLLSTKKAVEHFGDKGGSVINVSSVAAYSPPPNGSVYAATKGAVDTITLALARELGPKQIRVNSINPGMIETEGVHSAGFMQTEFPEQVRMQTPLGRIGQPVDVASVAAFFASDDSAWVSGEILRVAGGFR